MRNTQEQLNKMVELQIAQFEAARSGLEHVTAMAKANFEAASAEIDTFVGRGPVSMAGDAYFEAKENYLVAKILYRKAADAKRC